MNAKIEDKHLFVPSRTTEELLTEACNLGGVQGLHRLD